MPKTREGRSALRSPRVAILLAALSGFSLLVNKNFEGFTLIGFTPDRGLTAADLVGFAGYLVALSIVWCSTRHKHRPGGRRATYGALLACTAVFLFFAVLNLVM